MRRQSSILLKINLILMNKRFLNYQKLLGLEMGSMERTCGALTGALMVTGYLNSTGELGTEMPKSKAATYALDRVIVRAFLEQNGSMLCKDLKAKGSTFVSCDTCITRACDILEKELENIKGTTFE